MVVLTYFTYPVEKCIWNVATPVHIQLSSLNNKSEFHSNNPRFPDPEIFFSFLASAI